MPTDFEIKSYKKKALPPPSKRKPNSIYYIKADTDTEITAYITDTTGNPYNFKDIFGAGVQTVTNTDGTITVSGVNNVNIKVSASIMAIINNAVQPSDLGAAAFSNSYNDLDDLPVIPGGTNLTYTTNPTQGTVNSDTGTDAIIPSATTVSAGLISASDKSKLDGIESGAQVNVPTNINYVATPTNGIILSSTGSDDIVPLATNTNAGLLSPSEKTLISTALQSGDNVSELVNDSGYVTGTNLTYTPSPTQGTVISDNGTDAVIPLADVTNAGLTENNFTDSEKANLANQSGVNTGDQVSIVGISGTKAEFNISLSDGDFLFDGDAVENITSTGGTITATPLGDDVNLEVVQATESQLGGAEIVTQVVIEDETTINNTDIVSPIKFWQGWAKGLTLTPFFNAVRNTILTGFNSAITWARVTTSSTIQDAISLLQRQSNYLQATRVISGTGVTINGGDNTKFDIQVIGEIVNPNTFIPTAVNVNLTAQTATYRTIQVESYLWIDSTNTVIQSLTPPDPINLDDIVGYWVLIHSDLATINVINSFPYYADGAATKINQILRYLGFSKFKGTNIISPGTTGTRISHTGGNVIRSGGGNTNKRPVFTLSGATDATFRIRNQNSSEGADTQTLDVTTIDIGGVTTVLAGGKYGVYKVWKFGSSLLRPQRGQKSYDNYNAALAGITADPYIDEGNASRNGLHVGWIIFKKSTTWSGGTEGSDWKFLDSISNGGSGGGAIPTLQAGYDVSTQPQILTDSVKGAVQIKRGSAADSNNVIEVLNGAGAVTAWVAGDGTSSFGGGITVLNTNITASNLTSQTVAGFVTYINNVTPFAVASNEEQYFTVTDSGEVFKLIPNARSFGTGEPAISASDVIEINKSYFIDKFTGDRIEHQATGAAISSFGAAAPTTVGSGTNGTASFAGGYTGAPRSTWNRRTSTGAVASGTSVEFYDNARVFVANELGFYFSSKVAVDVSTNSRAFCGLMDTITATGNVDPSTLVNILGFAFDSADTNWQIMHNDGSGSATKVDTGINPDKANALGAASKEKDLTVEIWNFYGSANVYFRLKSLKQNTTFFHVSTTNLPSIMTGLTYHIWANSGADSVAIAAIWSNILIQRQS